MMAKPRPSDLNCVDLCFAGEPGLIAAYLLVGPASVALVETGPSSTVPVLLDGLRSAGVAPEDLTDLLVTHIHLDHAGGAGALLRHLPRARLLVHHVGAPHLVDPTRLLRSAARIYGDQLDPLFGPVVPAPADRVVALRDGDRLAVAGWELVVLETPGHASHHVAFVDGSRRAVFTGDALGVHLADLREVLPPTPPPELDLPRWYASLDRLAALDVGRVYFTHFGERPGGTAQAAAGLKSWLARWEAMVADGLARGLSTERLVEQLRKDASAALRPSQARALERFEHLVPMAMNVDGYRRYLSGREARAE